MSDIYRLFLCMIFSNTIFQSFDFALAQNQAPFLSGITFFVKLTSYTSLLTTVIYLSVLLLNDTIL
jgi:hypothetical protein